MSDVTKNDVAKAFGGPFVEYAILSLEQYGFHHTAHLQWDEIKRLARLGAAVETMPPKSFLAHRHERKNYIDKWVFRAEQKREEIQEFVHPCQCPCCLSRKLPKYATNREGETATEVLCATTT